MSKCENCRLRKESAKAFDIHWHDEADCPYAHCPVPDFPQTNGDRIRQMSDEELADRIMGYIRCEACEREFHIECNPLVTCRGNWLDWLKSPVEVDNANNE